MTNAVFVDNPNVDLLRDPLSRIIPCAMCIENMSAVHKTDHRQATDEPPDDDADHPLCEE